MDRKSTRLSIGDLIAGVRILLVPIALVAALVAAGRVFQGGTPAPVPAVTSWLAGVPHEAWAWALIAYLAAIAPRQAVALRLPGLPLPAKGLIVALAGFCFLLELQFHDAVARLMQSVLTFGLAAASALAAAAIAHARRMRRRHAEDERDRLLQQMILTLEQQNNQGFDPAVTHPALFAELGSILKAGSAFGTSIWFLRPHPALSHKRPIDVLREPGGEAELLRASRLGPNF